MLCLPLQVALTALPSLKYVVQRSEKETFAPATTAALSGPAVTFDSGYDVFTDNTANWPADTVNPTAKVTPYYRVALCLDPTCTIVHALAAAKPNQFFHYGVYTAHAGAGSPVKVRCSRPGRQGRRAQAHLPQMAASGPGP
jgi:hypothetical protein